MTFRRRERPHGHVTCRSTVYGKRHNVQKQTGRREKKGVIPRNGEKAQALYISRF